jgi:hypothetical protein
MAPRGCTRRAPTGIDSRYFAIFTGSVNVAGSVRTIS